MILKNYLTPAIMMIPLLPEKHFCQSSVGASLDPWIEEDID